MRKFLMIIFVFNLSLFTCAQKIKFAEIGRKSISIFPSKYSENGTKVAYLVDGKLSNSLFILSVGENYFDSYYSSNITAKIEGKDYESQIYFTTKKGYEPKLISIKDIKTKYAKNKDLPCIYFINNNPVKIDEKNIVLDENNILEICCHLYVNNYDDLKINIIEIFTKSELNIEKSKTLSLD